MGTLFTSICQNIYDKIKSYIDKKIEVIHRKVLKGTHLPVEVKEIQAGYL